MPEEDVEHFRAAAWKTICEFAQLADVHESEITVIGGAQRPFRV